MVREYHAQLGEESGDAALARAVAAVAPRVHDLSTLLTGVLGVTDVGAHRDARRPDRPPGAALYPLLGVPERVPGLRAGRRPRLRLPVSGPIGAILSPQLRGMSSPVDRSLPYASSLCGACYDVCPVAINIPEALVYLRSKVVDAKRDRKFNAERTVFGVTAWGLRSPRRLRAAQRAASASRKLVGRSGTIRPNTW